MLYISSISLLQVQHGGFNQESKTINYTHDAVRFNTLDSQYDLFLEITVKYPFENDLFLLKYNTLLLPFIIHLYNISALH